MREDMSTKSKVWLVLIAFLVITGALLLTEHRAHVLGLLVWLPLLACLLVHVFMHGGRGHHGGHGQSGEHRRTS